MIRAIFPVVFVVLLVGCNKTKEPPPSQVNVIPAPQSAEPARKSKPPEPYVDLESLPVREDYEVEAKKIITLKTLPKKVDELEKELETAE